MWKVTHSPPDLDPGPFSKPCYLCICLDLKWKICFWLRAKCLGVKCVSSGNQIPDLIKCRKYTRAVASRIRFPHISTATKAQKNQIRLLCMCSNECKHMAVAAHHKQPWTPSKTKQGRLQPQWNMKTTLEYTLYRNPSRCYRAKGKCIGIIPSGVRAAFLSLLLPPPQLSRIQVDTNHQDCFVSPAVLVSNVQRWVSRPGRRNFESELSCCVPISVL